MAFVYFGKRFMLNYLFIQKIS